MERRRQDTYFQKGREREREREREKRKQKTKRRIALIKWNVCVWNDPFRGVKTISLRLSSTTVQKFNVYTIFLSYI